MTERMTGEHKEMMDVISEVNETVNTVGSKVSKLEKDLEFHLAEGHELYVQRAELEGMFSEFVQTVKDWLAESRADRRMLHSKIDSVKESHERVEQAQDVLANVVLGEPHLDIDGQTIRKGGMKEIVDDYVEGHKGFKVQLPWGRITVALITAVGTIVAAIIMTNGGGIG